MKLAFITPTVYLNRFASQGDIYLALAHLIDDQGKNAYARFHRREAEKGRRVILDNGLFEGAQVSSEALIQRARAVRASVVCAPDVLYDSKGTIKEFKSFVKLKHEAGLVCDLMGIPQADNPADWWECFQFMDMHSECSLIGLSILSVPKSFRDSAGDTGKPITDSRVHLIRQLDSFQNLSGRRITPCHMLGLGESYRDVIEAQKLLPNTIVSNDSSSAFVHGMKGVLYRKGGMIPGGKNHEKLDFLMGPKLTDQQKRNVQFNINEAKWIRRQKWS